MRLTLTMLGLELDVTFGLAGGEEPDAFEPYQDAGTIASDRIAADPEPFGEARISNHFWDPGEGDEDRRKVLGFRRPQN